MLKIDSRSRSDVGRIAFDDGPFRLRPRNFPPTMRMRGKILQLRRGLRPPAFLFPLQVLRPGGEGGEGEALPVEGGGDERSGFRGSSPPGSRNGAEKSAPASRSTFSPSCSRNTRVFTSSTAAGASSPS